MKKQISESLEPEAMQGELHSDVVSWNSAISACSRCSEWQHAMDLAGRLPERGVHPDSVTTVGSLSACEKGCKWASAIVTLLKTWF